MQRRWPHEVLPSSLSQRAQTVDNSAATPGRGDYVLYWMHHAIRCDENPALNVAVRLANELRLPLLVYQAISERYRFASDRHHTFMLQGARDVQQQFRRRSIPYAFHLERDGHRGPHLRTLASSAAVLVTEEMPVAPCLQWTSQLAHSIDSPVVLVDASCVVPMQMLGRPYERAFQFREATKALFDQWLGETYDQEELLNQRNVASKVPFEPLDLSQVDIGKLVRHCEIDHSVGPIAHTIGGTAPGYDRWQHFKQNGLRAYASRRNDPLLDGTSRLSPYLHYGMVSPFRIAREAAAFQGAGAEKFLDELLIWRELAYVFCFHREDHESLSALPRWAKDTLLEHARDERPALFSWETLARGKTGDPLWDAAQQSLLRHGELHNNLRMTWGKAVLNWTAEPESALATIIDLNHRYALDGRDPASYGGILWCLGGFDRPFNPARPITGTVRSRPTGEHARRLDVTRYARRSTRANYDAASRVAIIGAGISGLVCARTLLDHGVETIVFEKSRGVGGRMATRRTAEGPAFDHGAQYFTARDERFRRYVESWCADGIVAEWQGRICSIGAGHIEEKSSAIPRYVGVPGMNSVCRHLASDLNIVFNTRVEPPTGTEGPWQLYDETSRDLGRFDYLISSAPAAQTATLMSAVPKVARPAATVNMAGCWAVMLAFDSPLPLEFDGAFVQDSALSWVARNSSKVGRNAENEAWMLHASPQWTGDSVEAEPDKVARELTEEFWNVTGLPPRQPRLTLAHRWRYALPTEPLAERCLFDEQRRAGACGDWCSGPRVEGAFLSGMAIAGCVLSSLAATARPASEELSQSMLFQ